jgi:hypothetical protein
MVKHDPRGVLFDARQVRAATRPESEDRRRTDRIIEFLAALETTPKEQEGDR